MSDTVARLAGLLEPMLVEGEVGPRCSSCGSDDTAAIAIGYPNRCCIDPEMTAWFCRACRSEFGRLGDRSPGMFREENEDG